MIVKLQSSWFCRKRRRKLRVSVKYVLFARDAITQEALLDIIELGQRKLGKYVETAHDARRHGRDAHAAAQPLAMALRQRHGEAAPAPARQPPRADSACPAGLVGACRRGAWGCAAYRATTPRVMSSAKVIDAYVCSPHARLFERTVDIVQSLPPSGPIQTSYEEKLALYGYVAPAHADCSSRVSRVR